jgi:hypothetical protein
LNSLIDELATYNDKGNEWMHHNEEQKEKERNRLLLLIEKQINLIGSNKIPFELVRALKSSELKTDSTGKYLQYLN